MAGEFVPGGGPKCQCGSLEREAQKPNSPIKFDAEMNEYYISYFIDSVEETKLCIYHCLFCGGAAPDSFRPSKFAALSYDELERLEELTKDLKTVDLVLATFGKPDNDMRPGVRLTTPETDEHGETTESFRVLTYRNLSQTANVSVMVLPGGETRFSFQGKYLGKSEES
jgi:hypothetical protein